MTSSELSGTRGQTTKESSPLLNSPTRTSLKSDRSTVAVEEVVDVEVDEVDVVEEDEAVEVVDEVEGEVGVDVMVVVMVDIGVTETEKRLKVPVCHLLLVPHRHRYLRRWR